MSFFPHTTFGIWSDILIVAYILFFILADAVVGSGPDYNVVKAIIFTVIGGLIAAAALATGVIGIWKKNERSILVYLSSALGAYFVFSCIISLSGVAQSA